jgi:hypothetical protein|tara:strand:+ start:456 stop:569 length:114 start_codon:yes stop_codon:yes gene_type:complete
MTLSDLIIQLFAGVFITVTVVWMVHTAFSFFTLEKDE